MSKRRRNPSFPAHENYGAQDPSDPALAYQRAVGEGIKKYILKTMKRYNPLLSLDKAGIIKEAEYSERDTRDGVNRYIRFTTGKGQYPQLLLSIDWSGYELLSFKTGPSPTASAAEYEPEEIKLVCDMMRYTVTGKTAKLEATIDELVSRGKM